MFLQVSPGCRAPLPPRGLLWCLKLPPAGRPLYCALLRLTPIIQGLYLRPGQLHTQGSRGIYAQERLVLWVLSRSCVPPYPRQGTTELKEDFKMSLVEIHLPPSRPLSLSCHSRTDSFHPLTSPVSAAWNSKHRMTYLLAKAFSQQSGKKSLHFII